MIKSISAIQQLCWCDCGCGPTTIPTMSTLAKKMEKDQYEYSTLYMGNEQPIQVLTPCHGQPAMVVP